MPRLKAVKRPNTAHTCCFVCGKPCQPHERNQDGTYAHAGCLKQVQVRPSLGGEGK